MLKTAVKYFPGFFPIPHFLRDLFSLDTVAGSVDSTPAAPGPGLRHVTDTTNLLSVISDELVISGVVSDIDPALYWTTKAGNGFQRYAGLCLAFYVRGAGVADYGWVGWSNSATPGTAALKYGIKGRSPYTAATPGTNYAVPRGDLQYVLLLHDTGAKLFYKAGENWALGYAWSTGSDATIWPMVLGAVGAYYDARIFRVSDSMWSIPHSFASAYVAGSVALNQTWTHSPEFILNLKFDNIGSSSGTSIAFAIEDASNYWYVYVAVTTIYLYSVVAGTPTQQGLAFSAISNGKTLSIVRRADANQSWTFSIFVDGVLKIAAVYKTQYLTQTAGKILTLGVGAAISELEVYPIALSTQPPFDSNLVGGDDAFGVVGDSKSVSANVWLARLSVGLERETRANWACSFVSATAGHTVANGKAAIDAAIAAHTGTIPSAVFCNFGANDVSAMPLEADYKANYLYIADALNTAFGCEVYVADAWRRGETVDCTTLAGWNAAIVAARTFIHQGHNELAWFEGGDDGVTYSSDGTHYSENGQLEVVRQWLTALGY